jgi:ATPase subunit of ABC transporter with duplicated ATPase domains
MPTVTALAATVATKTFAGLAADLAKMVLREAAAPLRRTYEAITTNFEPHLQATFIKCTKIKTLLNREAPVELLSQYVNLKFSSDHKNFDDYDVISKIRREHRVVISGTAGTGKTIFMKYLWLSLFEDSQGRIPVFIELRRLNDEPLGSVGLVHTHNTECPLVAIALDGDG